MKRGNSGVVFGHMHEDHAVEMFLLDRLPVKRALIIASGGDLAFALAGQGINVTAVDSNPAQIELVRLKMADPANAAALCFCGRVDRGFRYAGPFIAWLMDWPRLKPGLLRRAMSSGLESVLSVLVSLVHGKAATRGLDRDAIHLMRRRLLAAMTPPDATRNPLLNVLLGNRFGPVPPEVWSPLGIEKWKGEVGMIQPVAGDLRKLIRTAADGSLGLVSVSNIPDMIGGKEWVALVDEIARTLAPGGYLIARSMLYESLGIGSPGCFAMEELPVHDSSPLCPVVWIGRRL